MKLFNPIAIIFIVFLLLVFSGKVKSQETDTSKIIVGYGDRGFELKSHNNKFKLQIQSRFQFRYYNPYNNDPYEVEQNSKQGFALNRARLKVGGNAFQPWIKFYWEYELSAANLLDFRFMIEKYRFIKLKVGQWKVHYNRERIISSGKQQTVERSIITRPFTVDRQQGVSLYGRLGKNLSDFNYWISVFNGTGRGSKKNDDKHLMYMARLQWNIFGRELKFSGSDLLISDKPIGLLAVAGVTNRSKYTRFSQQGGGQLYGFEEGVDGQYRVNQFLVETAIMYKGFSMQQEFHWKEIDDKENLNKTYLIGNLIQTGYFPGAILDFVPKQLEIAVRYSIYFPDRSSTNIRGNEYAFDINWFFNGHLNKLTSEVSYVEYHNFPSELYSGWRFRIQWDISI